MCASKIDAMKQCMDLTEIRVHSAHIADLCLRATYPFGYIKLAVVPLPNTVVLHGIFILYAEAEVSRFALTLPYKEGAVVAFVEQLFLSICTPDIPSIPAKRTS